MLIKFHSALQEEFQEGFQEDESLSTNYGLWRPFYFPIVKSFPIPSCFSNRSEKKTHLAEYVDILLPFLFLYIPFNGFSESENISVIQWPGRRFFFSIYPKNITLKADVAIVLHVKFRHILFRSFREVEHEKS